VDDRGFIVRDPAGDRWSKKIKYTLVQALMLCTGRMAHRGIRGIALPFNDHGTWRGWGVSVTPRPLFTPVKDPVPILQETGWTPGPVWTCTENLAPTGIRSPDRPARSQSLYLLSYPAHRRVIEFFLFFLSLPASLTSMVMKASLYEGKAAGVWIWLLPSIYFGG
jgi:hypothetical protein